MIKGIKNKLFDYFIFLLMLIPLVYMNWYLFYRQSVRLDGLFHSDMYAYTMYIQGIEFGLRFPYPILFFTAKCFWKIFLRHHFLGPELGMAISTLVYEILAIIVSKLTLDFFFEKKLKSALPESLAKLSGVILSLAAIAINYVSMLFIEGKFLGFWTYRYMGVFTPNIWHNSTYIASKPFAILTFLSFASLFEKMKEKKESVWDYLFFSTSLLLTTLAKPSYTIVFGLSAVVITLFCILGKQTIRQIMALFLSTIPTLAALIYQYIDVFTHSSGEGEKGIGISLCLVWNLVCSNIPTAILMAGFFPFISLVFNFRKLRTNYAYIMSWLQYFFGIVCFLVLYEKGSRMHDGNFVWGYCHALFIVYFTSLMLLIDDTISVTKGSKNGRFIPIAIQWIAFTMHLINGIVYYVSLMHGEVYV